VAAGTARLRVAFTAGHEADDVLRLADAVRPFITRAAA
jgi:7-keto-8-aminopelargonate synthetase-like enzyme